MDQFSQNPAPGTPHSPRQKKRKKVRTESILFYIVPFILINFIIFRLATAQPDFALTIGDCVDYRSVTFEVKMTGPLPVSDFRVLLNDEPVEMTESGSRTYTATVTKNGTLEVTAGYFNGMMKTQYERINAIDDEPPVIVTQDRNGTYLTVGFDDAQTGVDMTSVYALDSDGTTVYPVDFSAEDMTARFQSLSNSLDVHIKDQNGNEASFVFDNLSMMGGGSDERTSFGERESSGSSSGSSGSSSSGNSSSGSSSGSSSSGNSSSGSSSSGGSASETKKAKETTAAETTKAKETTKASETTKAKETTKASETSKAKETTKASETSKASETTKASATETAAADPANSQSGSSGSGSSSVKPGSSASGTSSGNSSSGNTSSSGSSSVPAGPVSTTEAAVTPTDSVSPGSGSSSGSPAGAASPSPQTSTTAASPAGSGASASPAPTSTTAAAPVQTTAAAPAGPSSGASSGGTIATVEAVPGM